MKLTTAEKFLLIAHQPEKGRFLISEVQINYGIIGAMLLEMSLEQKISIKNDKLIVNNHGRDNDEIISEISSLIYNSKKERKIRYWLTKLSRKSGKYKWAILNELVNKRMMRIEKKKFLGIIPYRLSYITDDRARRDLIRTAKSNILSHKDLSDENVVVLGLIEACKMYKIITTDKEELKRVKKELKEIIKESPIAETLGQTIQQVQAAVIAAVVTATAASAATSSR